MLKNITKFQDRIFNIIIVITYILYITIALGISSNAPKYLGELDKYMKIYISLFLIWRFNPFRTIQFTELDRKIGYTAGIFLFTTTAINQILINYINNIKSFLKL